jgi:hypothetical protein
VSVYQLPKELRLPHNVLERTDHGGNTELVNPIVRALALGQPPDGPARYQFIVSDWGRPRDPFKAPQ